MTHAAPVAGRRTDAGVGSVRRRAGFAVLVLVVLGVLWAQLAGPVLVPTLFRSGDTSALTTGAEVAYECLRDEVFRACGRPAEPLDVSGLDAPASRVDRYALLLYVPAVAVQALGFGRETSFVVIGVLNALSFVILTSLPWIVGRRLPAFHRARSLWALVMLGSPLLPYAGSTWSEVLAATLVAGAVVSVAAGLPGWAGALLAFGAGISKETMAPFVVLLCVGVVAVGSRSSLRSRIPALVPVVLGSAAAVAANALFNVFRFGTPRNLTYLAPFSRVGDASNIGKQAFAVLFAPNGGLLVYWPLVLFPAALAWRTVRRADGDDRLRLAFVLAAFSGFCLSLGMWYSPFGWNAWGPRLMLPIVPAVVFAVLVLADGRVAVEPRFRSLLVVAFVLALPNVAVLASQRTVNEFMNAPLGCPNGAAATDDPFSVCMVRKAWGRPWLPVVVLPGLRDARAAGLAVVGVAAATVLAANGGRLPGRRVGEAPDDAGRSNSEGQ